MAKKWALRDLQGKFVVKNSGVSVEQHKLTLQDVFDSDIEAAQASYAIKTPLSIVEVEIEAIA